MALKTLTPPGINRNDALQSPPEGLATELPQTWGELKAIVSETRIVLEGMTISQGQNGLPYVDHDSGVFKAMIQEAQQEPQQDAEIRFRNGNIEVLEGEQWTVLVQDPAARRRALESKLAAALEKKAS